MKTIGMFLLLMLVVFSGSAWADMIIIAHENVPETNITQKSLQEIFLGKRVQWQDNSAIHPATVKAKELHKAFLKQYIKKSISKWSAHWKRIIFTGNGTPPKQFETQEALLEYVVHTEGAIGYADSEAVLEHVTIINVK